MVTTQAKTSFARPLAIAKTLNQAMKPKVYACPMRPFTKQKKGLCYRSKLRRSA